MSKQRPDMELLALAGMTKAGLKNIDSTSVGGGSPHADKIDMRDLAGMNNKNRMKGRTPNILKSMDFIDMPKSRPLGQVSMEGENLPPPQERPVDFMPIPTDMQNNVEQILERADSSANIPPNAPIPEPKPITIDSNTDFDLFQFAILKDIVSTLNVNIDTMEDSLDKLKGKRDMIMKLIKGEKSDD